MQVNNKVHIAMALDDNYVEYLSVAICSILMNFGIDKELYLYILIDEISYVNKKKIEAFKKIRNFNLFFLSVGLERYGEFKCIGSKYISKLTLARFQLPGILTHLDKCIYLDCDVVLRSDISELWNFDLGHYFFGAVEDPKGRSICARNFNIDKKYSYFNTGVLLYNLKALRGFDFQKVVDDFFFHNTQDLLFADQDVFNALFYKDWLAIPIKWNVIVSMYWSKDGLLYYKYDEGEVCDALKNPSICHFTESKKPDSFLCKHPYRKDYLKYRKLTEWRDCPLKDVSLKNVFIRFGWAIRNFFFDVKRLIRKSPVLFVFLKSVKRRMIDILKKIH
jgi:lipopolysaccharide biosynthesis glycosyltransferase